MKRLIFLAGLLTAIASPSLFAQSAHDLRADIPFSFQMGKAVLPAGTYFVHETNTGLITLRESTGKGGAARLTIPTSRSKMSDNGILQFTRYGDSYFLAKVWDASSHEGRALVPSKQEKELEANSRTFETASVILKGK